MTAKAEQLRRELCNLPSEDRAALARFFIASLDDVVDEDAEAAWDEELKRREEDIRSGKEVGESADKVMRELRAKYS